MHQTLSRQKPSRSSGFWKWSVALGLLVLPLVAGFLQQASSSPEPAAVSAPEAQPQSLPAAHQEQEPDTPEIASDISEAPVRPVSTEPNFPSNIHPSAGMSQVVSLAEAAVDESVLLAFVTNSTSQFNLGSDEIIYLNDIGVPASVITAMLQHDQSSTDSLDASVPSPAAPTLADQVAPFPTPGFQNSLASVVSSPPPAELTEVNYPLKTTYESPPQPTEGAYSSFHDSLAPYGTWVDVQGYGRCWQPTVVVTNPGWQPYLDSGRWVYTDSGWYWMSDYSWGWAPFHYGRWFRHQHLGWCWSPDTVWAPSWVCWRYTDEYCGWAPLPPAACFTVGVGLTFHGRPAKPFSDFHLAADCFPFVPLRNLCDHHLRRHALLHEHAAGIFKKSTAFATITPHNHTVFNHGLAPERVSDASHVPIHAVAIRDTTQTTIHGSRERVEARGATLSVFRLNSPPADQSQPAVEGSPRRLRPTTATLAASQTPVNTSTPAQPSRPPGLARPAPPANASGFVLRGDHWTTPNVQSSTATGSSLVPLSTSAHRSPSPEATNPGQHNSSHQYSQLNSHRTDVAAMRAQTSSPRSWSPPLDSQVTLNERRSPFATRSLSKNIPDKNRETPSASTPPDLETSPVQAPVFGVRHQNSPMTAQYSAAVHHRQSPPSDDAEQPAPIPSRSNAQAHQSPFEAHRNSSSSEHTRSATPAESHQAHFAPAAEARQSHSAPVAESHQSPSAPANSSSSSSSSSGHSSSSSGKGH